MASPASSTKEKENQPPAKRLKRAFNEDPDDAAPVGRVPKKRDDAARSENTPPPSPPAARPSIETGEDDEPVAKPIDLSSINDEIVEAAIVQLQNTGNRPHLVKELAAVLMPQLKIVQQCVCLFHFISPRQTRARCPVRARRPLTWLFSS